MSGNLDRATYAWEESDETLEFPTVADFPVTGELNIIYVDLSNANNTAMHRWSGSAYVPFTTSSAIWGFITGLITDQADLKLVIDAVELNTLKVGITVAQAQDIIANNAKVTNVTTNITITHNVSTVVTNSSDGSNGTINAANASTAGIMTKAMYDNHILNNAKSTNITTDVSITYTVDTVVVVSSDGSDGTINAATTSAAGIMTKAMFDKLEGIADNATAYSHPATHPATMIDQDTSHRFLTDAERLAWNGKEDGLGNPSVDGYVLKSTIAGVRTWEADEGNVVTNISVTHNLTTVVVNSSDGSNGNINAASASASGIMTKAMYDNHILNNAKTSANNSTITVTAGTGLTTGGNFTLNQSSNKTVTIDHLTTAGNKHIPAGGSTLQVLSWLSDGTAQWSTLPSAVTNLGFTAGATTGVVSSSTGTNATLTAATVSAAGLMTAADKVILNAVNTVVEW